VNKPTATRPLVPLHVHDQQHRFVGRQHPSEVVATHRPPLRTTARPSPGPVLHHPLLTQRPDSHPTRRPPLHNPFVADDTLPLPGGHHPDLLGLPPRNHAGHFAGTGPVP
jgi:hypothetical protein